MCSPEFRITVRGGLGRLNSIFARGVDNAPPRAFVWLGPRQPTLQPVMYNGIGLTTPRGR